MADLVWGEQEAKRLAEPCCKHSGFIKHVKLINCSARLFNFQVSFFLSLFMASELQLDVPVVKLNKCERWCWN